MKFLLVNPYYPISETPSPPLGLAYLAGALERFGVEVKVLDLVVNPYSLEMLESSLKEFSPNFVGITSVTMTFNNAMHVLRDVKIIDPCIMTVIGGPHVTFSARETLESFPEVDIVVLGEGEATIIDLIKEAENDREWIKIKGIAFRRDSEIISTGFRGNIPDVNSLPSPARHLLPLGRYRALGMPITMTTSRGCPFKCIFCVGRKMSGPKVRYRSPAQVVDELEYLSGLNFKQINIADDLFTANGKHCISICDEIVRRKIRTKWTAFSRVDTVSKRILHNMKEAGCDVISFGVESGNTSILNTIKKGIRKEQVISAIRMCRDSGIIPHASFILGLPGETPETLKETREFGEKIKDLGASYGYHLLAPFPGTEIREKNEYYGIKILTDDWSQYHANRAVIETSSVNRKMLDEMVMEWEKIFNEWLGDIKSRMENGKATEYEAGLLVNLEHTVIIYKLMMDRLIELNGSWNGGVKNASKCDLMKALVEKIRFETEFNSEEIIKALELELIRENLSYTKDNNGIRWQWVDFL